MLRSALLVALVGCAPPAPDGPTARFDLTEDSFWASPWPSDLRTHEDGTLDLSAFPNPYGNELLSSYVAVGDTQVGFGTNSPIYFTLDGPPNPATMPTWAGAHREGASLQLVDIDPASSHRGERFPLRWQAWEESTPYRPENLLAVAPVAGFPLRPATTYALLITTEALSPSPDFAAVWQDDHPHHALFAELQAMLPALGLSEDEIAVATVFTTTDPVSELATLASYVKTAIAPAALSRQLEAFQDLGSSVSYRTHYQGPRFTHGSRPYLTEGGGFVFNDAGVPELDGWDDMRLLVCTPPDLSNPPPGGWPVVIYQHGTGGDYSGVCDSRSSMSVGTRLAEIGVIGLGIDQPLHGTRTGDSPEVSDLAHFNIVNPVSARTNFRQGAIDAIYLAHSLRAQRVIFKTPAGDPIALDPDHVMFMGHSQGGLTGALALPFLDVDAAVLSAAGGGLSITIVDRKDILDFAELMRTWLQFEDGEEVEELHPVVGLVQSLVEVTDPANYAPYWFSQPGWWQHHPASVLLTNGLLDEMTPYRTAEALAGAARMPPLRPQVTTVEALELRGVAPRSPPLADNTLGFDGSPVTAGFSQWADGTHFVVFTHPEAADLYQSFLATSAQGRAVLADTR